LTAATSPLKILLTLSRTIPLSFTPSKVYTAIGGQLQWH